MSRLVYLLGKSTLLSALSGRLVPIDGLRTEGDGLELGVFTQDLAQDLVSQLVESRGSERIGRFVHEGWMS